MGNFFHGSATPTEAVRRAIQHSRASPRALAQRHGVNPKTLGKWNKRDTKRTARKDQSAAFNGALGLPKRRSIVAFRQLTVLPLDDCLYALQPFLPHLTRSSLHRFLQRQGSAACHR